MKAIHFLRWMAFLLPAFLTFGCIVWLWFGLSPHVVGIFEHLGQAQYPQERRKVLRGNLLKWLSLIHIYRASELAEKETMPVIVRDLDDDAATRCV